MTEITEQRIDWQIYVDVGDALDLYYPCAAEIWEFVGDVIETMRSQGWLIELYLHPRGCVMWRGSGDRSELVEVAMDHTCDSIILAAHQALVQGVGNDRGD